MKNLILLLILAILSISSFAAKITDSELKLGKKTAEDIKFTFDIGSGAANPFFKWDNASSSLFFSNDGSLEKKIGSGSGSGGSGGINTLTNEGFEDGVSEWTLSGLTLTQNTYTNSLEVNTKYASTSASTASGEYIERSIALWPSFITGGCVANFKYINGGGFNVEIYDGATKISESGAIPDSSEWVELDIVPFKCPASGSTAKIRIISTGAGQSISLDDVYLGSNKGFFPLSNINSYGARIQNTGATQSVLASSYDFIDSLVILATGEIKINYKAGIFTAIPSVIATAQCPSCETTVSDSTLTYATIQTRTNDGAETRVDVNFDIEVTKQGADASKAQSGYTPSQYDFFRGGEGFITNSANDFNIGTGSDTAGETSSGVLYVNPNMESMQIACAGTEESSGTTCTGNEQAGFSFNQKVVGSTLVCAEFVMVSSSTSTRSFKLYETPNNAQTIVQGGNSKQYLETNSISEGSKICEIFTFGSTGKKTIRLMASGSGAQGRLYAVSGAGALRFSFTPIQYNVARPVINNMVDTSYKSGLRVEHCRITNAGTPTTSDPACSSWITSLTDNGAGATYINFVSGTWSQPPSCFIEWNGGGQGFLAMDTLSVAGVQARTMNAAQALIDIDFNVTCIGVR